MATEPRWALDPLAPGPPIFLLWIRVFLLYPSCGMRCAALSHAVEEKGSMEKIFYKCTLRLLCSSHSAVQCAVLQAHAHGEGFCFGPT